MTANARPISRAEPVTYPAAWDLELRVSPEGGAWSWEIRLRLEEHEAVLEATRESHEYRTRLPRCEIEPLLTRLRTAQVPLWSEDVRGGLVTSFELSLGRLGAPGIRLRWAGALPSGWEAAGEVMTVLRRHVPFYLPG